MITYCHYLSDKFEYIAAYKDGKLIAVKGKSVKGGGPING